MQISIAAWFVLIAFGAISSAQSQETLTTSEGETASVKYMPVRHSQSAPFDLTTEGGASKPRFGDAVIDRGDSAWSLNSRRYVSGGGESLNRSRSVASLDSPSVAFEFSDQELTTESTLTVNTGFSSESFVLSTREAEPKHGLSHYFFTSPMGGGSWVIASIDKDGNPYISTEIDGSRSTFTSTRSKKLLPLNDITTPSGDGLFSEEVSRASLVRHRQVVELSKRGVINHQATWRDNRMVRVSGGDLGRISDIEDVGRYLKTIDGLMDGASALASSPMREVMGPEETNYIVEQVVSGVPIIAKGLKITVDVKSKQVRSLSGPIYRTPKIDVDSIQLDATELYAAVSAYTGKGLTEAMKPELVWMVHEEMQQVILVWRGVVYVPDEGKVTYYVRATDYEVVQVQSEVVNCEFC